MQAKRVIFRVQSILVRRTDNADIHPTSQISIFTSNKLIKRFFNEWMLHIRKKSCTKTFFFHSGTVVYFTSQTKRFLYYKHLAKKNTFKNRSYLFATWLTSGSQKPTKKSSTLTVATHRRFLTLLSVSNSVAPPYLAAWSSNFGGDKTENWVNLLNFLGGQSVK